MNIQPTENGTIVLVADTSTRLLSVFVPKGSGKLQQVLIGTDVAWSEEGWVGENVVQAGVAVSILVDGSWVQVLWDGQLTLMQGKKIDGGVGAPEWTETAR